MTEPEKQLFGLEQCPFCGGSAFTWGRAANGQFYHEGIKLGNKISQWIDPGEKVYARKCNTCSNIQLFLDKP